MLISYSVDKKKREQKKGKRDLIIFPFRNYAARWKSLYIVKARREIVVHNPSSSEIKWRVW